MAKTSVDASERWWITELGQRDLVVADTCECDPVLAGLLIRCKSCQTVYGTIYDFDEQPRGAKRTNYRGS